ncbi:uncharacterized protein YgbK (DUF1537 family) [Loktanella ponticola]|uniref:Uncharacterized protein YgbK (DUF1537 family) n=1 Tax=Yoonia ponticola TaxID=1524255 RepID=A0A7W9BKJ3_9RHOB|nr:hypothetical protein [Yoonia ponticola]MBB5722160.1 uncharacterized protein YgbK (DUF1537 family) [Yoonia ponticola]
MRAAAVISAVALAGCTSIGTADVSRDAFAPVYHGIETRLLDGDLVNFRVAMTGAQTQADVDQYARCAAAQYTLIRGYGFTRHVRTTSAQNGAIWTGDAVFVISPELPAGNRTIDAEVTVADCGASGIPTV